MRKSKMNLKQVLVSITALTLVLIMTVSFTYSWVEGGNKGYVDGGSIQINSSSTLTMIQAGKNTSSITVPTCNLSEVSSADGKNYYFPMGDNISSQTASMTFREGTPADVNTKYVSLDFDLVADDSAADVYLGSGTIIQCTFDTTGMTKEQIEAKKKENKKVVDALRMAFFTNDGEVLRIFKPTQMPGSNDDYSPITTITEVGVPTQTSTATEAYGDYYFKGNGNSTPLFSLKKGETKKITLAIWLEGTEFTGNTIADEDLSIYIDFTTTVEDLIKYNFIDNTHGYGDALAEYWVSKTDTLNGSEHETMMYIYDNTSNRYYAMDKAVKETSSSGAKWIAYVPKTITDFTFRRYSIDIDQWWNEWNPSMSDIKTDPDGTHTFIAICGNGAAAGTELTGCFGYWQDEKDTIRIYFQLEAEWNDLHCYAWGSNNYYPLGIWPGSGMTFSYNAGSGSGTANTKPIYYVDIEGASKLKGILFNNGKDCPDTQKIQIEDSQYFFNGMITWGKSNTEFGHWLYREEKDSKIYPNN